MVSWSIILLNYSRQLKNSLIAILLKLFPRNGNGILTVSFYEASITLILKPDKDILPLKSL